MNKLEALGLVGRLAEATSRNTKAVNGLSKKSPEKAAKDELKAANDLLKALGVKDATEREIEIALGW